MNLTFVPVNDESDILPVYRGTAVGDLLAYHNLGAPPRNVPYDEQAYGMPCEYKKKKVRGEVLEILE